MPEMPNDPFAFFRSMWKPMEMPMQAMFPPMTAEDVDKKIQEFRTIEQWLQMNLNMLQMSIRTLEMQKAAFENMRTEKK